MLVAETDTKDPNGRPGTGAAPGADVLLDDRATVADVERAQHDGADLVRRGWSATWPKLAAVALALFLWQCVVWSG
ncbi:MAG: ABC transporter permease, partial [Ilumatobacteraceae bacterium]